MQGNRQGFSACRPSSLHDIDADAVVRRAHRQPQQGRRRLLCGRERPHHDKKRVRRLSGEMQPPQRGGMHLLGPKEQRPTGAGPEDLLGGPESIGHFGRAYLHQLFEGHIQIGEGRPIGHMWRLHERDRPPALHRKRRPQQPHLTHTRLLNQQIHECSERPAAARQFGRQRGIARLHRTLAAPRQLGRAPERRVNVFGVGNSGKHRINCGSKPCMDVQYATRIRRVSNRYFFGAALGWIEVARVSAGMRDNALRTASSLNSSV